MSKVPVPGERPLLWGGSSKKNSLKFPDDCFPCSYYSLITIHESRPSLRCAMAQAKSKRNKVESSSGNVFADLNLPDAEERQTKVQLAVAINRELAARQWSQSEAAEVLGINQPKVSALQKYRLEGFSVERLMLFLTALGNDVAISIKRRSRGAGRISVQAA